MSGINYWLTIFGMCLATQAFTQTEGRNLLAAYPLLDHLVDTTGQEDTLDIENVFLSEEGLYFSGADPQSDTVNIAKVWIDELDFSDFYISLDIKLDSIPEDGIQPLGARNIFTGGLGFRWMRAVVSQQFDYLALWHSGATSKTFSYDTDQWYNLGMAYSEKTQRGTFYINGFPIAQDSFELMDGSDRWVGIGCNCGNWPFKGHWKNLMIYGPDNRTLPLSLSCTTQQIPDDVMSTNGSISLTIEGGFAPYQVSWNGGDTTFPNVGDYVIDHLGPGIYSFEIFDDIGVRQNCETSLQLSDQLLPLVAHYPFQGSVEDELGLNDSMAIQNIDVLDTALYIDGAESGSDTQNVIFVSRINALNHRDFEIKLDFNLDSTTSPDASPLRTIFLAGTSFRWASLNYHNERKELNLRYNNSKSSTTVIPFEFHRWYEMTIRYNRIQRRMTLLLDGAVVDELDINLEAGFDKSMALTCCNRHPMRGYWRNLRIYSSPIENKPLDTLLSQTVEWNGTATSADGTYRIFMPGGDIPYEAKLYLEDQLIDSQQVFSPEVTFENLSIGSYEVRIADRRDTAQLSFEMLAPQTDLPIQSYFPLDQNRSDTAFVHSQMELTNVKHILLKGLLLPGNANRNNEPADQIFTSFSSMNTGKFYMSLNVTIDSVEDEEPGDIRSIFVLGTSTRWLYPYYSIQDQKIYLAWNGERHSEAGSFSFEYGKEYELAIGYDQETNSLQLYIDRKVVINTSADIETGGDVSFGLNCICGPDPMKGFWRDLRLYGEPEGNTTSTAGLWDENPIIAMFPNPVSTDLHISISNEQSNHDKLFIYDALGRMLLEIKLVADTVIVDMSTLSKGSYWVRVGNRIRKLIKI